MYRVLKISGSETLDKPCKVILDSFGFIDEHLYEFCMDNKMYSRNSYQSDPEGRQPSTRTKIGQIGLREKQKFSLHYDFGDDWMFTINVQNIQQDTGRTEPYIIKGKGSVEQYPDWDDEWE